jgi:hypothetical protein
MADTDLSRAERHADLDNRCTGQVVQLAAGSADVPRPSDHGTEAGGHAAVDGNRVFKLYDGGRSIDAHSKGTAVTAGFRSTRLPLTAAWAASFGVRGLACISDKTCDRSFPSVRPGRSDEVLPDNLYLPEKTVKRLWNA